MDQRHAYNVVKAGEFPATDLGATATLELIWRHEALCDAVLFLLTDERPPEGDQQYRALIREKVLMARNGLPL